MICSSCGTDKPTDAFQKHRRQCKSCRVEYTRRWHRLHPNKEKTYRNGDKRKAWELKNADRLRELSRLSAKRNGYKQQKRWKAANKNKVNSYTRLRQARIKTTAVEFVDYDTVIAKAAGICQICLEPFGLQKIEVDHIIPLATGGSHTYDNVQAAHASCNRKKWIHLPTKPEPDWCLVHENFGCCPA